MLGYLFQFLIFFLWLYHTILKKCLLYEAKSNEQKTELFEYVYAKGILEY